MSSVTRTIRIGTRSSPMALAQVERVRGLIAEQAPNVTVDVVPMTTSGDKWTGPLSELGGKGAFTKECDLALTGGEVDLVVHCVKDVPGDRPLPTGTAVAAYLTRDDVRDALVHPDGLTLDELPAGTRIGTSAVRRAAQLALHWPHLTPVPIRGNANSRLAKLDAGVVDALLVAAAGLRRIDVADRITQVIAPDVMVPAVGSGTLMLLCREADHDLIDLLSWLGDPVAWRETVTERTMLHILQGNCHSPIGGYARTEPDGRLSLHGRVMSLDGKTILDAHEWGTDPMTLATSVAAALMRQGAREIIAAAEQAVASCPA